MTGTVVGRAQGSGLLSLPRGHRYSSPESDFNTLLRSGVPPDRNPALLSHSAGTTHVVTTGFRLQIGLRALLCLVSKYPGSKLSCFREMMNCIIHIDARTMKPFFSVSALASSLQCEGLPEGFCSV